MGVTSHWHCYFRGRRLKNLGSPALTEELDKLHSKNLVPCRICTIMKRLSKKHTRLLPSVKCLLSENPRKHDVFVWVCRENTS